MVISHFRSLGMSSMILGFKDKRASKHDTIDTSDKGSNLSMWKCYKQLQKMHNHTNYSVSNEGHKNMEQISAGSRMKVWTDELII